MKSELVLVRVAQPSKTRKPIFPSPSSSPRPPPPPHPALLLSPPDSFTGIAQWDPNQACRFAVDVRWGSFEFIPAQTNEIVFFQENSSRILFAKLPAAAANSSFSSPPSPNECGSSWRKRVLEEDTDKRTAKVYCVGRHPSSFLLGIAVRSDGLAMASTATSGSICVWRLSDGALLCQTNNVSLTNLLHRQPFVAGTLFQQQPPPHFGGRFGAAHQATRNFAFVDKPWGMAMGCPDGKVQLWTMQNGDADPNHLSTHVYLLKSQKLSSSDKASVSAITLHIPQTEEEPLSLSDDEKPTGDHFFHQFYLLGKSSKKFYCKKLLGR